MGFGNQPAAQPLPPPPPVQTPAKPNLDELAKQRRAVQRKRTDRSDYVIQPDNGLNIP